MSSGSGPRATGTDGSDHKFRQRVNTHYTLMAQARGGLGLAVKLHAAHLVASALCAAVAFFASQADAPDWLLVGAAALAALGAGVSALRAAGAAKSTTVAPVVGYAGLLGGASALVVVALVAAGVACARATEGFPLGAQLVVPAQLIGLGANAVGYRAAGKLQAALAEAKSSRAR